MPRTKLHTQSISERLHGELRSAVRSYKRHSNSAAERSNIHNTALALAQEGEKRLCDRDLSDHVDLELLAHLAKREKFKRARDSDTGIIDYPCQPCLSDSGGNGIYGRVERGCIGDIKQNGGQRR